MLAGFATLFTNFSAGKTTRSLWRWCFLKFPFKHVQFFSFSCVHRLVISSELLSQLGAAAVAAVNKEQTLYKEGNYLCPIHFEKWKHTGVVFSFLAVERRLLLLALAAFSAFFASALAERSSKSARRAASRIFSSGSHVLWLKVQDQLIIFKICPSVE